MENDIIFQMHQIDIQNLTLILSIRMYKHNINDSPWTLL